MRPSSFFFRLSDSIQTRITAKYPPRYLIWWAPRAGSSRPQTPPHWRRYKALSVLAATTVFTDLTRVAANATGVRAALSRPAGQRRLGALGVSLIPPTSQPLIARTRAARSSRATVFSDCRLCRRQQHSLWRPKQTTANSGPSSRELDSV